MYRVGRCTSGTLYVSGEKIPLDLYTVLRQSESGWVEIKHWRELLDEPEQLFIIPRGLEHDAVLFKNAGWAGAGSKATGTGKKGERAKKTWSHGDSMSVYAMRAQSEHIKVSGAGALREAAILSLLRKDAPSRLCEALWVSPDGRLAGLAAVQHRPDAQMISSMAKSESEHLRVRAARLARDKRVLLKLLGDSDLSVRRAAICNERSVWEDIIRTGREGHIEPELLEHRQADEVMLQDAMTEGGLGARVAIAHPKMRVTAERMMQRGNRLATFAAANPALNPTRAIALAKDDMEINSVLAGNKRVVSQMTAEQAGMFIERLAEWGMAEEIGMVAQWATLSGEKQRELLQSDLSEIVAWGLSLSTNISKASQMTILAHCSAVGIYTEREGILSNLCANPECLTEVLAASDTTIPSVAQMVKSNPNTSGTIRDEARRNLEISVLKRETELLELMSEVKYYRAPREHVLHLNEYKVDPKPVASVVLNERVIESSAVFERDAGMWAMGGDSIDLMGVVYGGEEHTVLTLRIDQKRAQKALETNWVVDSVGVCLSTGDGEIFQLIDPVGSSRGYEVEVVSDAVEGRVETRRERMVRAARKVTTGVSLQTAITHGAKVIPGGSTAVKRVKNLVEFEKVVLGKPRGHDRTAVLPVAVMPGDTLSILLPDCKRSECVAQTIEYSNELKTCGRVTEEQRDTIERWVKKLDDRASKSLAKNTLPTRYLDMLRYQAGRRRVVDMIVNGDTPWHEEETQSAT